MVEIWKDIKGYEGLYQVSNLGRVRSLDHIYITKCGKRMLVKGQMKKPSSDNDGYMFVLLRRNGKQKRCAIHRLVAKAFITNQYNKPEVNHIDAVKSNNRVDNLEWVTGKENIQHAMDKGLMTKGTLIIMDGKIVFSSITKCAKHLGVDNHEIRRALNGEYKTVHGHVFARI